MEKEYLHCIQCIMELSNGARNEALKFLINLNDITSGKGAQLN